MEKEVLNQNDNTIIYTPHQKKKNKALQLKKKTGTSVSEI